MHGDLHRLIAEAGFELCQPIKATAYLLGGMDAGNLTWRDFSEARQAIEAGGYASLVDDLHRHCRVLWESQSDWSAEVDVLAPLVQLARDVFKSGGIYFWREGDGECRMEVPFTPETMPDATT